MFVHHALIGVVLCTRARFVETRMREMRVNSAEFERWTHVDRAENAPCVFRPHAASTHADIDFKMHRNPRAECACGKFQRMQIRFVVNSDVKLTTQQ